MTIDKAVLQEMVDRLTEAAGAVERLNEHMLAIVKQHGCIVTIWATGQTPAGC
ncbi:MAG: hypothetical protein ACTHOJ_18055 [Sphingomonas oligoaromativorans]